MIPAGFFFLRPLWLLLLLPAVGLVWLALRGGPGRADGAWTRLVDPHLLAALSVGRTQTAGSRWLPVAFGLALTAATVAMAGPTWQRIELPSFRAKDPVVVAMSLAQSMNADDIKPTRLVRAGHKLSDILDHQEGGDTGLVIYSDRPFIAAPLTADGDVIRQMLPELSTDLMPVLGNRGDLAVAKATELLHNADANTGHIVVIADSTGSDVQATVAAAAAARRDGYTVDVIAVGKQADTTLRGPSGGPIAGKDGAAIQAGFDPGALRQVAQAGGGIFTPITADGTDVDKILPEVSFGSPGQAQDTGLKADGWADMGFWLLLVPVLLAPLAFRRNLLMAFPLMLVLGVGLTGGRADAADMADLWRTPDQQGAAAFSAGDYGTAAADFRNPGWRAASLYREGDFVAAAQALQGETGADADYNRGNALARSGDFEGALAAYDEALTARPGDPDAMFNRDLVEKLLTEQQQQQHSQDQQNGQQGDQQHSNGRNGEQDQPQNGGQNQNGKQADQQRQEHGTDPQQADQQQQQGTDQQQPDQNGEKPGDNRQQEGEQPQAGNQQSSQQQGSQQSQPAWQQQPGQLRPAPQTQSAEQAGPGAEQPEDSAFQRAMDAILSGNGEPAEQPRDEQPQAAATGQGISEQDQADEQLLRSVPDDASGLLRARIRQAYARYP